MVVYWSLFAFAAASAFAERSRKAAKYSPLLLGAFCAFSTVMIGTRLNVGADWSTYIQMLELAASSPFGEAMARTDPGYMFPNWVFGSLGLDIWSVNTFCAAIFCYGLYIFCASRSYPMLALVVAVPYLLIVVAMGYTRQSAAIGLFMIAITRAEQGRLWRFLFWVALAALFHKSAVMIAPIGVFAVSKNKALSLAMVAAVIPLGYLAFLADHVDQLTYVYIEREYASGGAFPRLLMGAATAAAFLLFVRRRITSPSARRFWTAMAAFSVALFALLPVVPSSSALDRLALYSIPFQMMTFSVLPVAFRPVRARPVVASSIILAHALVLYVWMFRGTHARLWMPYETYLF